MGSIVKYIILISGLFFIFVALIKVGKVLNTTVTTNISNKPDSPNTINTPNMPNTPTPVVKTEYRSLKEFNFTVDTFPLIDGATATQPIRGLIVCKALNLSCDWDETPSREMFYSPTWENFYGQNDPDFDYDRSMETYEKINKLLVNSKTHEAYLQLIDKNVDLIIVATEPSKDEQDYALQKNVDFDLTPIALDGFVFLLNKNNPLNSLTTKQITDIYQGSIVNWKVLGGSNLPIKPYVRQRNSGSQELMEKVFLKGTPMKEFPEEMRISGMMDLIEGVDQETGAIGYSLYYYKNTMVDKLNTNPLVKVISVDGVEPNTQTISQRKYPYVFNIYAVTRKDQDKNSDVVKLKSWLNTSDGQALILEAGYSPFQSQ